MAEQIQNNTDLTRTHRALLSAVDLEAKKGTVREALTEMYLRGDTNEQICEALNMNSVNVRELVRQFKLKARKQQRKVMLKLAGKSVAEQAGRKFLEGKAQQELLGPVKAGTARTGEVLQQDDQQLQLSVSERTVERSLNLGDSAPEELEKLNLTPDQLDLVRWRHRMRETCKTAVDLIDRASKVIGGHVRDEEEDTPELGTIKHRIYGLRLEFQVALQEVGFDELEARECLKYLVLGLKRANLKDSLEVVKQFSSAIEKLAKTAGIALLPQEGDGIGRQSEKLTITNVRYQGPKLLEGIPER